MRFTNRVGDRIPFAAWHLGAIKADQAYADLQLALGEDVRPGDGVTIGFIDSGIDLEHPEFPDQPHRTVTETALEIGAGVAAARAAGRELPDHGQAIASLAAGWSDGSGMHGVAWGANVEMFAVIFGPSTGAPPGMIGAIPAGAFDEIARFFEAALGDSDIDIINASFAVSSAGVIHQLEGRVDELRRGAARLINSLAQDESTDKKIIVWAGGNDGFDSVNTLSGLQAVIPELRGHVIAVAGIRRDGVISDDSNLCGIAADWCIAAPSEELYSAGTGINYRIITGTSGAAPLVSGGLAVMKQLFRGQISSEDLVTRLFDTADKTGRYADEETYGQGLMDLGAATSPVGGTMIASAGRVEGAGFSFDRTGIVAGPALGDGLSASLAGREIAVFDELGAPFWYGIDGLVGTAERRPSFPARFYNLMAPWREPRSANLISLGSAPLAFGTASRTDTDRAGQLHFGLVDDADFGKGGHAALIDGAATASVASERFAINAFTTEGLDSRKPVSGTTLSWRPADGPVALRTGWLDEREGLLGSSTDGAFGQLAAKGGYAGIDAEFETRNWVIGGFAEIGTSSPNPQGGIVTGMSQLTTSAFSLDATRQFGANTALSLSVSQPLRVEGGQATLSVPIGRTPDGRVLRQSVTADLSPTGREIDIMARWRHKLEAGDEIRIGAVWTHDPGHVDAADPELAVMAGWRMAF